MNQILTIEGMSDCLKWTEKAPEEMVKLAKKAMRSGGKAAAHQQDLSRCRGAVFIRDAAPDAALLQILLQNGERLLGSAADRDAVAALAELLQIFGQDVKKKIGDVNDFFNLHNPDHEQFFVESNLPWISHLFTIIYFAILCLVIYKVLSLLFYHPVL